MYEIREAMEEDRDSAIRILWKAFDVTEDLEEVRKRDWAKRWNTAENEDWAVVATHNVNVVAVLSFFADESNVIRGVPIRFAAVWGVATEPHHRKKGLIRSLFSKAFLMMRERGMFLSILDPFWRGFYEKFGYAIAESRIKHTFSPKLLRKVKAPEDITTREIDNEQEIDIILTLEKSMARFGSRNFHTVRTLKRFIKNSHFHILERDNEPVGTVKFNFKKSNDDGLDLRIWGTTFTSLDIFPSIISLVEQYSTNVGKITWWCDPEIPVRYYTDDLWEIKSEMIGSKMMRIIDFEKYCEQILVPENANEQVTIAVNDNQCPWNNDIYTIIPEQGRLIVDKSQENPEIELNAFRLSQVISGRTPANLLRNLGEIECKSEVATKLEKIFPPDSFVSYERF
jgi:predicted acetyltransferase